MKSLQTILDEIDTFWQQIFEQAFQIKDGEEIWNPDKEFMDSVQSKIRTLISEHREMLLSELSREIIIIRQFGTIHNVPIQLYEGNRTRELRFSVAWHVMLSLT